MNILGCLDRFCDYYDHMFHYQLFDPETIKIYYGDRCELDDEFFSINAIEIGSFDIVDYLGLNHRSLSQPKIDEELMYRDFLMMFKKELVYREIIRYDRADKLKKILE